MTATTNEFEKVGAFAREVVAKRVAIVTVVTVLLHLAIVYHIITPDLSVHVTNYITEALDALAVIVATVYARAGVTPKDSPQNDAGVPLVPANDGPVDTAAADDFSDIQPSE